MPHHKRGRPKNRRAGCKPQKANGVKKRNFVQGSPSVHGFHDLGGPWKQEAKATINEKEQREEEGV